MQNNQIVLLKNLLRAGGQANILHYEKDKKKRGQIIGNYIGFGILYLMLAAYCVLVSIGFGDMGMIEQIPALCAITICAIEFMFTLLKTNGYLFAFKEYDMLMSLPFKAEEIVQSKFLYMYVKTLPWIAISSLPLMIGYAYFTKAGVLTCIIWVVLSAFLPLIPMVIASAIGAFIAAAGSRFKHKQLVQTIFTFAFIVFAFSLRFIIESLIRDDKIDDTLKSLSAINEKIGSVYLPAAWFSESVLENKVSSILLLIASTLIVYAVFYTLVGKFYRQINTRLMAHAAGKKYRVSAMKTRSAIWTIAYKECRRLLGSTTYLTNVCIGELLALIGSIAVLFFDMDAIIGVVSQGAPLTKEMILPAVPMIVYFLVGMLSTTACSYSLEGKNLWIMQSLPIDRKTLFQGKMLFNMCLQVPFTVLGNICIGAKCGATFLQILLMIICGIILCAFSTTWGMRCDIKHGKFEWENEIEVVKQGSAVALYLLPNMFVSMILVVIAVALAHVTGPNVVMLIISAIYGLLALLLYRTIK